MGSNFSRSAEVWDALRSGGRLENEPARFFAMLHCGVDTTDNYIPPIILEPV